MVSDRLVFIEVLIRLFCKAPVQRLISWKTNSSFEEKLVTNTLAACLAQFKQPMKL